MTRLDTKVPKAGTHNPKRDLITHMSYRNVGKTNAFCFYSVIVMQFHNVSVTRWPTVQLPLELYDMAAVQPAYRYKLKVMLQRQVYVHDGKKVSVLFRQLVVFVNGHDSQSDTVFEWYEADRKKIVIFHWLKYQKQFQLKEVVS